MISWKYYVNQPTQYTFRLYNEKKFCTLGLIHYMCEVVKKSVTLYTMLLYKDLY